MLRVSIYKKHNIRGAPNRRYYFAYYERPLNIPWTACADHFPKHINTTHHKKQHIKKISLQYIYRSPRTLFLGFFFLFYYLLAFIWRDIYKRIEYNQDIFHTKYYHPIFHPIRTKFSQNVNTPKLYTTICTITRSGGLSVIPNQTMVDPQKKIVYMKILLTSLSGATR